MFPEYNRRAGRLISLGDRIVDCFMRSQNATGAVPGEAGARGELPTPTSKEVLALSAYVDVARERIQRGQQPVMARAEHDSERPR